MQEQVQTLAEVIREARVRARLSMRELARRSGLSAAQISRIEAGEVERPVAETLVRLAKALGRDAQLLLVFAGHIRGARAQQLLRQAIEVLPEPSRAEHAPALSRLDAESERERRLRDELADAERALTGIQQDLDATRERVSAEPPREARKRLREVGMLAQRRAVEVAQKRRQLEQLEDAPSEENCALAGRLFLDTAAGGEVLEAWRQYSGQITPDDPELRQLLEAWRQLGHERRKKVLEFSQEQLALSLLRAETSDPRVCPDPGGGIRDRPQPARLDGRERRTRTCRLEAAGGARQGTVRGAGRSVIGDLFRVAAAGQPRRLVTGVAFAVLAIAASVLVARRLTDSSWPLANVQPLFAAAAGFAYMASFVFRARGWHRLFPPGQCPDQARCLASVGAAAASGAVLPFRLDYLVKVGVLRKLGGIRIGLEAIVLSIISLGMIDAIAMLPLAISATATS